MSRNDGNGYRAYRKKMKGRNGMEEPRPQPRLYRQLNEYCRSDAYPFHMPGHKRRTDAYFTADFPNPYSIDITEIDGFDNLHHAEGILRESMDWAASVYGAGRTCYLINGSTCGVQAAICAAVPRGGTILMARNSHMSAYRAAALAGLNIRYVYPLMLDDFGLQGGLLPQDVEKMLISPADSPRDGIAGGSTDGVSDWKPSAVFITSPTYDGVVSDVRGIAEVCHRHGVPLIVDEAHGAHFPFGEMFPVSALALGADIVIHSLHKTLPAFTQTALLHVRESALPGFADLERLEYALRVFQTSSPSYVLMAGIERCIEYMAGEGRREMERFAQRLAGLREDLRRMRLLRLLDRDSVGCAGVYDLDESKIVVSTRGAGNLSGAELAEILRRDYHLEMEMCGADYVTAITTLADSEEGLARLGAALSEIDERLTNAAENRATNRPNAMFAPRVALPIHEAQSRPLCPVPMEEAAGRISGEAIYLYPPGTPVVVPGEILTQEIVDTICAYRELRLPVQGLRDRTAATVRVLM